MDNKAVSIRAFLLSTSQYKEGISPLKGVENSINELNNALKSQGDVCLCLNESHSDATDDFMRYIKATPVNDILLFYFCGHGFLADDSRSLILGTSDTSDLNRDRVGIDCAYAINAIKNAGIKNYFLILDCCHSGLMTNSMGDNQEVLDSVANELSKGGGVIISSTKETYQRAKHLQIGGKFHAVFTHFFAQVLQNGISEKDSKLSMEEIYQETSRLMDAFAKEAKDVPPIGSLKKNNLYSLPIFKNHAAKAKFEFREQERPVVIPESVREKIVRSPFKDSELVFGLSGAVGTNLEEVSGLIQSALEKHNYTVEDISISRNFLRNAFFDNFISKDTFEPPECSGKKFSKAYKNARYLMELGNEIRHQSNNNSFLAISAISYISSLRSDSGKPNDLRPKHAYIIRSLKHPEEVNLLRSVYGNGFYLFGIFEDEDRRRNNLKYDNEMRGLSANDSENMINEVDSLISRDEKEDSDYGQQSRKTFQMSDFYINYNNRDKGESSINRCIDLIFGDPFSTPTFGEYAMFMAWCASLRSADLSRQIGAVVCKNNEVLTMGANDCPTAGGGLYWPFYDEAAKKYDDVINGRDYKNGNGYDANKRELMRIAKDLFERFNIEKNRQNFNKIKNSLLGNLTEYGRVVHAEMEAIVTCARNHISCRGADLYVTTFPCHNCAKHIIASGFRKVVYIEAYPKSRTFDFYSEEIQRETATERKGERDSENSEIDNKVIFAPFFGVGPRRFVDVFAMSANFLPDKKRKRTDYIDNEDFFENYGDKEQWEPINSPLRSQMQPTNYMDREGECGRIFRTFYEAYSECFNNKREEGTE